MKKILLLLFALALAACSAPAPSTQIQEGPMTLTISSTAFAAGKPIPPQYSCKGKGITPPLAWGGIPTGARSIALIMDDPDAPMGTFVHWVIFNIPPSSAGLAEGLPTSSQLPDGSTQGANSTGRTGYTGPCPPSGTHRYFFKLYALDATLSLSSGATKEQLLKAVEGHVLAQGELMGTFSK